MDRVAFIAGTTGAAATRLVDELLRQEWRVIGVSRKARKQPRRSLSTFILFRRPSGTACELTNRLRDSPHVVLLPQ
jgi:nucleoside-diphosphate-sugar epimerase